MKPRDIDYFLHQLNTAFCLLNWRASAFSDDPTLENKSFLQTEIEYLKGMINSFMVYQKLPDASRTLERQSLNLDCFLSSFLNKFSSSAFSNDFEYVSEKIFSELTVEINPFYFEELCRVFMENALKHTPSGEKISVCISKTNDGVDLSFKNTGVGIKSSDIENIWNPFFTTGNGSGLGLSIAKQISQALELRTSCESDGETFTRFLISIPHKFIQ